MRSSKIDTSEPTLIASSGLYEIILSNTTSLETRTFVPGSLKMGILPTVHISIYYLLEQNVLGLKNIPFPNTDGDNNPYSLTLLAENFLL